MLFSASSINWEILSWDMLLCSWIHSKGHKHALWKYWFLRIRCRHLTNSQEANYRGNSSGRAELRNNLYIASCKYLQFKAKEGPVFCIYSGRKWQTVILKESPCPTSIHVPRTKGRYYRYCWRKQITARVIIPYLSLQNDSQQNI
jgi:hypothetical protein